MKKILIIEDESQLRSIYRHKLEGEGFEVLSAGDGTEGLMMVRTGNPDLIILDIMLPVGLELLTISSKRILPEPDQKVSL